MAADDVRIGDFSKPLVSGVPGLPSSATTPVLAPKPPAAERLEGVERQIEADAQRDEAALKPMQSYEERLARLKISREQAAEIIDGVLLKGFWAETVQISKRVTVRLRTRTARDTRRAQERIEMLKLSYEIHYGEMMARYLLAASLEACGNDKFDHPSRLDNEEAIEHAYLQRYRYVETLPDPTLRILFTKLRAFDEKIATVLEEGSIENF